MGSPLEPSMANVFVFDEHDLLARIKGTNQYVSDTYMPVR